MNEVEITRVQALTDAQIALLSSHSILNLFNVLRGELVLVGLEVADDEDLLQDAVDGCDRMIADFYQPETAARAAIECDREVATIRLTLDRTLAQFNCTQPSVVESLSNIRSVCRILRARAQEVLSRQNTKGLWRTFSFEGLRADLEAVLAAMEQSSHGRYQITVNSSSPSDRSYDVRLTFTPGAGLVRLPVLLPDVMRDLIANARKYSPVGSRISVALSCSAEQVELQVADQGRGIPRDDLARVFDFGARGSNVSDVRTMGGGFGLTKALYATRQLNGQFFVTSEVGEGTTIRLAIPRTSDVQPAVFPPQEANAAASAI